MSVQSGQTSLPAAEELVAQERTVDAIWVLRDLIAYHEEFLRNRIAYNEERNWQEPEDCKKAREMLQSLLKQRSGE